MKPRIEDLFGQRGRIKILRSLSERGSQSITLLARNCLQSHDNTDRHVQALSEVGLVSDNWEKGNRVISPLFNRIQVTIEQRKGLRMDIE